MITNKKYFLASAILISISIIYSRVCLSDNHINYLFDVYPKLQKFIPYIPLGNLDQTPVIPTKLPILPPNVQFAIKFDGLSARDQNNNPIFSGNKRRKLEFLLAAAKATNKKTIYAMGGAGSNFATATTAYAKELGLKSTLVLGPQRNTRYTQRNLKLDLFYGANIVACPKREDRNATCQSLAQKDPDGYFVPLGGSNYIGAIGFVNAAFELKKQIITRQAPAPDALYVTVSSAATAAGLIVGLCAAQINCQVICVRIDDTHDEVATELSRLIKETSEYLNAFDATFPVIHITPDQMSDPKNSVYIEDRFAGEKYLSTELNKDYSNRPFDAYALTIPEAAQAIDTLYQYTGIKLDGTYSGKTLAACFNDIATGRWNNKTVLMWDTFCPGDFPECTSTVDLRKLPPELQKYFNGTYPLQVLDQGV